MNDKKFSARWVASYLSMLGYSGMDHAEAVANEPAFVDIADHLYMHIMPLEDTCYHLYYRDKCVGRYSDIRGLVGGIQRYTLKRA